MTDFTKTPSYFNNKEVFEKYLGQTSYYIALQNAVEKLIKLCNPVRVLELGSATGATTVKLAKKFPAIRFTGVDMREDVTEIAVKDAKDKAINNVAFKAADMCGLVKNAVDAEFVYMLYSFHHIEDPISKKIEFLADSYKNMSKGSYLCIAETFLPESGGELSDGQSILGLWNVRKDEGRASTFWSALQSLEDGHLKLVSDIANYSKDNEYFAGELVARRKDEYLIKRSWLAQKGGEAGFKVVLNEPVNALGDGVVLLYKE